MNREQIIPSANAIERIFRYNRLWLHLLLAGARVATGQTPKEVIRTRNKEFCVLEGGHIGILTGAEARQGLWLKVHSWLEPRSQ